MATHFAQAGLKLADGNTVPAAEALAGKKYIALYFSAAWCGPCQRFTPMLANVYEAVNKRAANTLEVVFVSADQDESSFEAYRKKMPWPALDPFVEDDLSDELRNKFKCEGFPTVVVLDGASGEVLNGDAVQDIAGDEAGANCPWQPPTLAQAFGDDVPLVGDAPASGGAATVGDLRKNGVKHVALYFSAHWCPPCKAFTPVLAQTYKNMVAAGKKEFEFVFVSSDRADNEFDEYRATMGFPAMQRTDPRAAMLKRLLGVQGIPTLVTIALTADGVEVISTKARNEVAHDQEGAKFPWPPVPLPAMISFDDRNQFIEALQDGKRLCVLDTRGVESADAVSAVLAAVSTRAAELRTADDSMQFVHLAKAPSRAKDACPKGCALVESGDRQLQCDECGESATQCHSCRTHDFDLCPKCYEAVAQPDPSGKFFARIMMACEKPDEKADVARIHYISPLTGKPKYLGVRPVADAAAAAGIPPMP